MSEDRTGETKDSRSFEERVFTRFDLLDERFGRDAAGDSGGVGCWLAGGGVARGWDSGVDHERGNGVAV